MNVTENRLNIMNPDKSLRFQAIADILAMLPLDKGVSLLDVGGYPCELADCLGERFSTTTADLPPCDRPNYVQTPGTNLPFDDDQFSVVVTSDVLEHVPRSDREQFLAECVRCAADYVLIGCPWGNPAVTFCEDALRGLHGQLYPTPHKWLDEHGRHGLPEVAETTKSLYDLGAKNIAILPAAPLVPWFYLHEWEILSGAVPAFLSMHTVTDMLLRYNFLQSTEYSNEVSQKAYYRVYYVACLKGDLPKVLLDRCVSEYKLNDALIESEIEMCQAIAREFRACAAKLKDTILRGDGAESEAGRVNTRRLESLTNQLARETAILRKDLSRMGKRLDRYDSNIWVRILRRLGMI